jgi:hypothetical protein
MSDAGVEICPGIHTWAAAVVGIHTAQEKAYVTP